MTVSAPNFSILPFSVQPTSTVQVKQDHNKPRGDQGFGAILGELADEDLASQSRPERLHDAPPLQRAFLALDNGVPIESGNNSYSLQVDIGDAALAFQAMPIVGPVAVQPERETDFTAVLQQPAKSQRADVVAPSVATQALGQPDMESAFISRPTDGRIETRAHLAATRVAAAPQHTKTVLRAAQSGATQAGVQSSQNRADVQHTVRLQQGSENARSAQSAQLFAAKAQLFAQLVAAANEYRVSVRGTQLTASERDQLMADIRAALRSHGLADLPISLTANSGAA